MELGEFFFLKIRYIAGRDNGIGFGYLVVFYFLRGCWVLVLCRREV